MLLFYFGKKLTLILGYLQIIYSYRPAYMSTQKITVVSFWFEWFASITTGVQVLTQTPKLWVCLLITASWTNKSIKCHGLCWGFLFDTEVIRKNLHWHFILSGFRDDYLVLIMQFAALWEPIWGQYKTYDIFVFETWIHILLVNMNQISNRGSSWLWKMYLEVPMISLKAYWNTRVLMKQYGPRRCGIWPIYHG